MSEILPAPEFLHLLHKAREALRDDAAWFVQSTGERLAVALVLNRAEWLQQMEYSIAEAFERIGPNWVSVIPQVAKLLASEQY